MDRSSPSSYVHSRPDWPHYRYDLAALAQPLAAMRYRQGILLGRMEGLGLRQMAETTLNSLTDEVQQSSAIEGENLPRDQVRSSLAKRLGLDIGGAVPASRNVDGVVEMTLDATQNYAEPLTADRLFAWHAALFPTGKSGLFKIEVGAWRTGPMQVVSGPQGKERIHYVAPEPERVPELMNDFLAWFELSDETQDPVLKAAVAHLYFVQIHGLDDGNGRIGRAIMDMALTRGDGQPMRFYSLSRQIAAELSQYYDLLEDRGKNDLEITPYLLWFVRCLDRAIGDALLTVGVVLAKAQFWEWADTLPLTARQRKVLARFVDGFQGNLTSDKYGKIAGVSKETAIRDINDLIGIGVLVKVDSGGRSTAYELAPGRLILPPEPFSQTQ
jgi:Fic family protein